MIIIAKIRSLLVISTSTLHLKRGFSTYLYLLLFFENILKRKKKKKNSFIKTHTNIFKQIPKIDTTLANRYHQQLEDIQEWLQITDWSQKQLSAETLTHVQNTLRELNLIEDSIPVTDILK